MAPLLWVVIYLIENGRKIASIALSIVAAACIIGVCVASDTGRSSLAVAGILGIALGFAIRRTGRVNVLMATVSIVGILVAIAINNKVNWWPHGVTIFTVGIVATIVGGPFLPEPPIEITSYYPPGHAKYEGDKQP